MNPHITQQQHHNILSLERLSKRRGWQQEIENTPVGPTSNSVRRLGGLHSLIVQQYIMKPPAGRYLSSIPVLVWTRFFLFGAGVGERSCFLRELGNLKCCYLHRSVLLLLYFV